MATGEKSGKRDDSLAVYSERREGEI